LRRGRVADVAKGDGSTADDHIAGTKSVGSAGKPEDGTGIDAEAAGAGSASGEAEGATLDEDCPGGSVVERHTDGGASAAQLLERAGVGERGADLVYRDAVDVEPAGIHIVGTGTTQSDSRVHVDRTAIVQLSRESAAATRAGVDVDDAVGGVGQA